MALHIVNDILSKHFKTLVTNDGVFGDPSRVSLGFVDIIDELSFHDEFSFMRGTTAWEAYREHVEKLEKQALDMGFFSRKVAATFKTVSIYLVSDVVFETVPTLSFGNVPSLDLVDKAAVIKQLNEELNSKGLFSKQEAVSILDRAAMAMFGSEKRLARYEAEYITKGVTNVVGKALEAKQGATLEAAVLAKLIPELPRLLQHKPRMQQIGEL